jgi:hypothetical protein
MFIDIGTNIDKESIINVSYNYITTKPKEGEKLTNLFTPANIYYSLDKALTRESKSSNQPPDMGLVFTDKVKLNIPQNNDRRMYKTKKFTFPYYCKYHDTPVIEFISAKTAQIRQHDNNFVNSNHKQLANIELYNNTQLEQLLLDKRLIDNYEEQMHSINEAFKTRKQYLHNVIDNTELIIIAILPTQMGMLLLDINRTPYVCITRITNYLNTFIKELKKNKYNIWVLDGLETIIKFTKEATVVCDGQTKVSIGSIKTSSNFRSLNTEMPDIEGRKKSQKKYRLNAQPFFTVIKEKSCIKLEDLEEGQELFITACNLKETGTKKKYIFRVEGTPGYFISNSFFEADIIKNGLPEYQFKLILGLIKVDKKKKKMRSIFRKIEVEEE